MLFHTTKTQNFSHLWCTIAHSTLVVKNAIHFFRVNSNLERELPEAYTCCWKKPKKDNKY